MSLLLLFNQPVGVPDTPYPLPGYNPGGGMGTAGSKHAKNFGRLLDEALNAPDEPQKKKKRTKLDREKAAEIERLLADLPVVRIGATARIRPAKASARVATVAARGGARARVRPAELEAMCPDLQGSGGASAMVSPAWAPSAAPVVAAEGIQNPTDEELSQVAQQLYRQHIAAGGPPIDIYR